MAFSDWFTRLEEELAVDVGHASGVYPKRTAATCGKTLKRLEFGMRECVVPRVANIG